MHMNCSVAKRLFKPLKLFKRIAQIPFGALHHHTGFDGFDPQRLIAADLVAQRIQRLNVWRAGETDIIRAIVQAQTVHELRDCVNRRLKCFAVFGAIVFQRKLNISQHMFANEVQIHFCVEVEKIPCFLQRLGALKTGAGRQAHFFRKLLVRQVSAQVNGCQNLFVDGGFSVW